MLRVRFYGRLGYMGTVQACSCTMMYQWYNSGLGTGI